MLDRLRIIGYATCTGVGFFLSLLGSLILFGGTTPANIRIFAVLYVLGNVIGKIFLPLLHVHFSKLVYSMFLYLLPLIHSIFLYLSALCATGFLLGPKQQCVKMWLPTRRWSTAFYLLMIIIVFVVALLGQSVFLVLFLLLIEIIAGTWYSLSYVPFGRKIVCTFFRSLGICAPCFYVHDSVSQSCQQQKSSNSTTNNVFSGSSGSSSKSSTNSTPIFGGGTSAKQSSGSSFWSNKV